MSLDQLIAEAEIGEEARKFVESDLGKTIIGMAQQDARAAEEALGDVDPTDIKAIVSLQNKIKLCRLFEQWLAELISRGNDAINVYTQQRST